jgi:sirohydrochlorin ferrochelatase
VSTLVLAAHGSVDPRSSATTHAVIAQIRALRPGLDIRPAFCEKSSPSLSDALVAVAEEGRPGAVVTPLLLSDAYHARIDIPGVIAESQSRLRGLHVRQAGVLGEDPRLLRVVRERLARLDVTESDDGLGVLVVAVGSTDDAANAQTATVATALAEGTRWAGAAAAFATGPFHPDKPTVAEAAERLSAAGASRLVIAPWFVAPGFLTDRVATYAHCAGIPMAETLGPHRLVAETVLERFDEAAWWLRNEGTHGVSSSNSGGRLPDRGRSRQHNQPPSSSMVPNFRGAATPEMRWAPTTRLAGRNLAGQARRRPEDTRNDR